MEILVLEGSPKTPYVNFNAETGVLVLKGRSIPENSIDFYRQLFSWFDNYREHPYFKTDVTVMLEYFNTSSSKCILDFFKRLESLNESGKTTVNVEWYFEEEDEDMFEAGEDYQAIINIPIKLVEIEEL